MGAATSPYKHCWESPTFYGVDNPHNVAFYARSDDGRVPFCRMTGVRLPAQLRRLDLRGPERLQDAQTAGLSTPLPGASPGLDELRLQQRLLTRWAQHYSNVTG